MSDVLNISTLSFSYDAQAVLNGIDLQISDGERVGLIGPNGCGKTTLFHLVTGLLTATSGQIDLYGEAVVPGRFRPKIGLVFQNPDDQLFSPTVAEDIAFGPRNMGLSSSEIAQRVDAAMQLTGIADLKEQAPHRLSGGQKRMVAIAGIIAMQPSFIVYDEPSANLDIRARRRLIDFIKGSQETILISSHDLDLILEVTDRVILLDNSIIQADGPSDQVMRDQPLMEAHGLETPHALYNHHNHRLLP